MIHASLPQTMTPENLAVWIKDNAIDQVVHDKVTKLDQDEIHAYEHKVATVCQALDDLESLKKDIDKIFKDGTDYDPGKDVFLPKQVVIPATKGTKALEANRKYYTSILKDGCITEHITLYAIPFPEEETIVFVNSQGEENESYRQAMTEEQKKEYNSLFKNPLDV